MAQGAKNLDAAIKATPGDKVVYGVSQSALVTRAAGGTTTYYLVPPCRC